MSIRLLDRSISTSPTEGAMEPTAEVLDAVRRAPRSVWIIHALLGVSKMAAVDRFRTQRDVRVFLAEGGASAAQKLIEKAEARRESWARAVRSPEVKENSAEDSGLPKCGNSRSAAPKLTGPELRSRAAGLRTLMQVNSRARASSRTGAPPAWPRCNVGRTGFRLRACRICSTPRFSLLPRRRRR